ncbi:MAG TPA: hypothetical protein VME46_25110, partial [Acidimicrobiales bacterium]|nr:hypothetical protein [Acidimicrobiales bacterium]
VAALAWYLQAEQLPELRQQAVELLSEGTRATPELLADVLAAVLATPEEAELLRIFCDRLASFPGARDQLESLFSTTGSTQVKLRVLELLSGPGNLGLYAAALDDASVLVRSAATTLCARHGREHVELIAAALGRRIPEEPSPWVRAQMIGVLADLGYLGRETGELVLRWWPHETSPQGRRALAAVLPAVELTTSNREAVLGAFLAVLRDPMLDAGLKQAAAQRLRAFEYRAGPEMQQCVIALMETCTDVDELGDLYERLRSLGPAPGLVLPLVHELFYRFVGWYPQAPLDEWARLLAGAGTDNEQLRAEIPYLVGLTGATWLLGQAGPADQKDAVSSAILGAVRKGTFREPERLLDEAYTNRTLRKSDAVSLFATFVSYHGSYPLVNELLDIFNQTGIFDDQLADLCLTLLVQFPGAAVAYKVQRFLEEMGPRLPDWPARLDNAFSPDGLMQFHLSGSGRTGPYPPPPGWDDYWSGPPELHEWPVAELFCAQPPGVAAAKLDLPVVGGYESTGPSLHSLMLGHLNTVEGLGEAELGAIARLARATATSAGGSVVHDRALYVFNRKWPGFTRSLRGSPAPAELARSAAVVFVEQCERRHALGPGTTERDPAPLPGMDLDHLLAAWPLGAAEWDALWDRYATYLRQPPPGGPSRGVGGQSGRSGQAPRLRYRPLDAEAHPPLFEFLFRTPLGQAPEWPARFRLLLATGRWHRSFSTMLSQAAPADRERAEELMAG